MHYIIVLTVFVTCNFVLRLFEIMCVAFEPKNSHFDQLILKIIICELRGFYTLADLVCR